MFGKSASLQLESDAFIYLLPIVQNTEDEVLKAAIAKYGKNQWFVAPRFVRRVALTLSYQGSNILTSRSKNAETMQGTLV